MRTTYPLTRIRIAILLAAAAAGPASAADQPAAPLFQTRNQLVAYAITADGHHALFSAADGTDYCREKCPVASVKKGGKQYPSTHAVREAEAVILAFGEAGVQARLRFTAKPHYLTLEVEAVNDEQIEELTFFNLPLKLKASLDEPFAACTLALNLRTNVPELPGPNSQLRAMCYPRFGMVGARVAIIACPTSQMRSILQEVVSEAPDLPHSKLGGPWALDAPTNRGSYLFNFGGLSEKNVDAWIETARRTGMNQIDFHGGSSFRFGDIRFNPETYPNGAASMKAVIDRLHAAGISAGLHTYAFFIDKRCKWVSPVPDPRLAKDATFTLADILTADAKQVPVRETTEKMSTLTGFFVWNSVTIQIDDELIDYAEVSKSPPYAFAKCTRGAHGTKPAAHAAGAKVHHLKECFGYFLPDGDSTLFSEVAARTAEAFNECGFDMMYLDALDGEGILGGPEAGWHYGSKFVYEIYKHLKRAPLMEMSTFHHHLWCVRSRVGAWDFSNRAHKKFFDLHCASNQDAARMFLPAHLGWFSVKTWAGLQDEPTYFDDIEYLCGKCIANDVGFSLQGVNPDTVGKVPAYDRLSAIMRRYEELRRSGKVPEAIKAKLRVPGDEYTLTGDAAGDWSFRPAAYDRHKVEALDGRTNVWTTSNRFGPQPLKLRVEALLSAVPYDDPKSSTIIEFQNAAEWSDRAADKGVTADLGVSRDLVKSADHSGCFAATTSQPAGAAAPPWASLGRTFSPPLNLKDREGLGVWVHGDGKGEVINVQMHSPEHLISGHGEHYIPIDFTGWRYFELMELDNGNCDRTRLPYCSALYTLYREMVHYDQVDSIKLWYGNLPASGQARCHISPIKALPLVTPPLASPTVTVNGKAVTFPVSIDTGCYLELLGPDDCKLYARDGKLISQVKPAPEVPSMIAGENKLEFRCGPPKVGNARACVTVITTGEGIHH